MLIVVQSSCKVHIIVLDIATNFTDRLWITWITSPFSGVVFHSGLVSHSGLSVWASGSSGADFWVFLEGLAADLLMFETVERRVSRFQVSRFQVPLSRLAFPFNTDINCFIAHPSRP